MSKASDILEEVEKNEEKKKKFRNPLKYQKKKEVDKEVKTYGKPEKKEPKKQDPKADRQTWSHKEKKPEKKEEKDKPNPISQQETKKEEKKKSLFSKVKEKVKNLLDDEDRKALISFVTSVAFYGVALNITTYSVFSMKFGYITWIGWGLGAWMVENKVFIPITKMLTSKSK